MGRPIFTGATGSVARALDEIGDPQVLLLVEQLFAGTSDPVELRRGLGMRVELFDPLLARCVEHGFVQRRPRPQAGAIVWEYFATEKAEPLRAVLNALDACGLAWPALGEDSRPRASRSRARHKAGEPDVEPSRVVPFPRR
ncbi:DNA-binding HxlR family transcriptional regulator [Crossiella equi]|uniref:DNA-binding HxlR family transcriptional regulator n=1 Tax=Crossiella equi TaxID=130796 RepID=A0ABS5AKE4_9PSEU|nr:helix-turn-helix transcriptional regulator [Crossiella equi]MBP2477038.1 DNA-binding HxlR family transcriptional regulator [Crossiella equi]